MRVLKNRKILIALLALIFILSISVFCFPFNQRKNVSAWSGEGTATSPYKITTAQQLQEFANNVNAGEDYEGTCFKLTKNISLRDYCTGGGWTPIGSRNFKFNGTLDGNDKTISDIYINNSINYLGLFGYIGAAGVVKNLSIDGSITGDRYVGGIAAINTGIIENCYNKASISGSQIGGIAGYGDGESKFINCFNTGLITGTARSGVVLCIGGIVGSITNGGSIENCFNAGNVSALINSVYIGGIAGSAGNCVFLNCYNTGSITGVQYVGGILGNGGTLGSSIICSYNAGPISGNTGVGAIIGNNSGAIITDCFYNSDISDNEIYGIGLSTEQMTHDDVFSYASYQDICGMKELQSGGDAWVKRLNDNEYSYYPELAVFYNSGNQKVRKASKDSVKTQFTGNVSKPNVALVFTYNGLEQGPMVFSNEFYTVSGDVSKINAGNYSLTLSLNSPDYKWMDGMTDNIQFNWEIKKAVLTVTAEDKIKVYGEINPELTYNVTGFVNGEDDSVITGEFSLSTIADESSTVDDYSINIAEGSAEADNYKFQFEEGTLTITKANPEYTVPDNLTAIEGQKLFDIELPEGFSWVDESLSVGLKGERNFAAKFTPLDTENYNIVEVEITITVSENVSEKTEGVVSVSLENWIYGSEPSTIVIETVDYEDYEIKYKLAGEDDETAVAVVPQNAGDYVLIVVFIENDSYIEKTVYVEFTIFKAKVSKPEATGGSFTYDNTPKNLLIETSDLYTVSNNSAIDAGIYEVKISLNDKENYEWNDGGTEDLTLELEIEKANPEYTIPANLTAIEGQKLSDIELPEGFSWVDESLSVGLKGERNFAAKFTPSDTENYNIVEVEITITVSEKASEKYKGSASVSIDNWTYGTEPSAIVIETDYEEWEVKYKLAGEDDETAVSDIPVKAGNYIAVVFFKENDTYAERIIDVGFTIFKAKVSKPEATGSSFTYDKTPKNLLIEASDLYAISGNSAINVGIHEVKISLNDKENYEWNDGGTEDLTLELKILKANPAHTVPTGLTAVEGQKLSDITLPSNFSWKDGNLSVGLKGERKFAAKFTPSDTANYNIIEVEVTITVNAAEEPEPDSRGLSGGAIAGIVIGCVLAVGLITALIIVIVKKKKEKN